MNRLVHSTAGYIRALQISGKTLFVFTEGGLDRSFCDRLFSHLPNPHGYKHEVRAAKELPSETGGKMRLISFYKELRDKNALHGEKFGKKFACLFFLDKDIDELMRKKLKSDHVVYTDVFDLEAHLFKCGNLRRAIADSCGVTLAQASEFLGNQDVWIAGIARLWQEWTALCIVSQIKRQNCGCTYERSSTLNPNLLGATDRTKLSQYLESLRQRLELTNNQITQLFRYYERLVQKSIDTGNGLKYFKGKWLKSILEKQLAASLNVQGAILSGSGEKILVTLVAQVGVDENCSCCNPFEERISKVTRLVA